MIAHGVNPILNVSDIVASVAWFEKWGWKKDWDWGDPPTFGAVVSGEVCIFLCEGGQGGRGKSKLNSTCHDQDSDDKGVWMSIWVDDVDEVFNECMSNGVEVSCPPKDEPWNAREMHVRHPDGHVFRVSKGIEEE